MPAALKSRKHRVYSPADISWPAVDSQPPVETRFGRAEYAIEEGRLPLEHAGEIKSHGPSQPDDEPEKNEVLHPAHGLIAPSGGSR